MANWWRNLAVAKKLYVVVGVMALLICMELFSLLFAMDTLSAVRAFVEGESTWSKSQKNAIHSLQRYALSGDIRDYNQFLDRLRVPMGDRKARIALQQPEIDMKKVEEGFLEGKIHPNDIPKIVKLIVRFHDVYYIRSALERWAAGDAGITKLMHAAEELRVLVEAGQRGDPSFRAKLVEIDNINLELSDAEDRFSAVLGEGSRWLENTLMIILILAVLLIEGTGLFLTFTFSRNLSHSLKELSDAAGEVGRGNFEKSVPVRSKDELGRLADAINQMTRNIRMNLGKRKQAESANQTKTLFLANMSHEIRTPLGVIMGLTELLKDPNVSREEITKYVEIIDRTGKNLTRIINDILDISRVETGHLEIERIEFSLKDFLVELERMLMVQAERNQNELKFELNSSLPDLIVSDRVRLRQIVLNLVSNALKHTHRGVVQVIAWATPTHVYFRVKDNGSGIPESQQMNLFKLFAQGESAKEGKTEGSGLGLVLAKRLAGALGGDVILEDSAVDKGSTFLISIGRGLKNQIVDSTQLLRDEKAQFEILEGKRILVVDDSTDNQILMNALLRRRGLKSDSALNGQEAIDKALNEDFDLVLMDMQMPIMDGYSATKTLRHQGYRRPIVALTAHAMTEDRDRCLAAGCDDYLTKPIESTTLLEALQRHISPA